jgi:hypothetical protein
MTQAPGQFNRLTGAMMNRAGDLFGFAVIVSFGVVYNGARIALSNAAATWPRCGHRIHASRSRCCDDW